MSWSVDYEDASGIVVVTYVGASDAGDLRAASAAAIALSKTHDTLRFLIDGTHGAFPVSPFALLDMPARQYPQEGADPRSRVALLLPQAPKDREAARFYETVCLNRGWQVESFDDRDAARRWLLDSAG
jgi:hypothetical protein